MDGIIIINKQKNFTSNDIVQIVKKMFNKKVGHTGTLDPMATGVLPLLIGKGTLCSKYLINHDKIYDVNLKLGIRTDTGDLEGNIVEEKNVSKDIFEEENVKKILNSFLGNQEQIPPMYSAIKVNGKKLYEYARKGEKVDIQPRKITIYEISLLKIEKEKNTISFRVKCSKGTYIRSLCEDIAKRLGTIGFMEDLNRIQVGEFNIKQAVTIDELEKNDLIKTKIITIEEIFKDLEKIEMTEKDLTMFLNGVKMTTNKANGIYKIYNNEIFIGTGIVENKRLKRDIIV